MLTIDASVWLNADSPKEVHHEESRALLDWVALYQTPIVVPTLLCVEVAAAISRTRRDISLAREYAAQMALLPFVRWVGLDQILAAQAAVLAAQDAIRGADAVYAAVAAGAGSTLLSLDKEHLTRLVGVIPTHSPADALARLKLVAP